MKLFDWHFTKNNDYPENYKDYIEYTLKSSEIIPHILVLTKGCKWHIIARSRTINEGDFRWIRGHVDNRNQTKFIKSFKPNVIMWSFLPTYNTGLKEIFQEIINK